AFFVPPAERVAARRLLAESGLPEGASYACLCPATTWANKHWSESGWTRLAEGLAARGLTTVFLGARGDLPLIERITRRLRISGSPGPRRPHHTEAGRGSVGGCGGWGCGEPRAAPWRRRRGGGGG